MASSGNGKSTLVTKRRNERELRRLLAPVACMVAVFVAVMFMVPAISMTRGEVVCGFEEHAHTQACYEQVLVCGFEEGEGADPETGEGGHVHDKSCYEKQLVCDIPEHEHVDGCFAPEPGPEPEPADDAQVADVAPGDDGAQYGAAEGDYAVQNDESAADINTQDYDNENVDASVGEEPSVAEAEVMPAQSFTADLKYKDGTVAMTVNVEAPEDAFPAGTRMKIDGVAPDAVRGKVAEGIDRDEKLAASLGGRPADDCMSWLSAVDVRFTDADANELAAARKCVVRITAPEVHDLSKPVLVRTLENKETKKLESAEVVRKVKRVNADEKDEAKGHENTLKFKATEFTTFAIVGLDADLADGANADAEDEGAIEGVEGEGAQEEAGTADDAQESVDGEMPNDSASPNAADFSWGIDGQEYELSIPRNGFISFTDAAQQLGLVDSVQNNDAIEHDAEEEGQLTVVNQAEADDASASSAEADASNSQEKALHDFVAGIESMEFSSSDFASVSKLEADATIGVIKEDLGLTYDRDIKFTKKQAQEIDETPVAAGDWVLIALKSFPTEERLTVTMESGEVFNVAITDTPTKETTLNASGSMYSITVTYDDAAGIPDGAELRVREIAESDEAYAQMQNDVLKKSDGSLDGIPSNPALFDISIWADGEEYEPADGSEVKVEVKLAKDATKGVYTDSDAPLLVNDAPPASDTTNLEQAVQVVHQVEEGKLEVMETTDTISEEGVVSEFTAESFSNWLLYLDEDLTDINVTTGDSLTLRPYTEWVWKSTDEPAAYSGGAWTFPSSDWNVSYRTDGGVNYTFYTHNTNGSIFRSFSKTDDQLNETYTVVTSVSLSATNGGFDLQTNKGKTIHVHVTQGAASGKPATVSGINGLTVNLFDYDVPSNSSGGYDFTKSGNLDDSGNTANSPFNQTVNINHNLKFLGWGATDSTTTWINNYKKDDPYQNIVKPNLGDDGFPVLNDGSNQGLGYLFDTGSHDSSVYAFANADGLFQKDNLGYYYYNSNANYAEFNRSTNQFVLYEHTYSQNTGGSNGSNAKPFGFFPFHEYDPSNTQSGMNHNKNLNHHFGMSMTVDFEIPKDRQMEDDSGQKHDIIYEFSGDDDLWVFVDDELALDIGGIHQPVTGKINFTTGVITVHGVDDITKTFDVGGHTLKMFYIERGGCDSNLSVRFNLPLTIGKGTVKIAKKSLVGDQTASDTFLPNAVFGIWENEDCSGEPYVTATSDANGVVDFGHLAVKADDQKYFLKELVPPDGYKLDSAIYTVEANGKNSTTGEYDFVVKNNGTAIEQMQQEPYYPIVRDSRPEPIDLSVHKDWQDAAGQHIDAPEAQAVLELKRMRTYVKETPQPPIPSGVITMRAGRVQPSGNWQTTVLDTGSFKKGTTATVTWAYPSNYNGQRQYRYSTNGGDNGGSWSYSAQNLSYNGSATFTIPNSGELWVYFYDDWNNAVSVSVSGTPDQVDQDPIQELVSEPDNAFSQTVTLPKTDGSNAHTFNSLPTQETVGGVIYYYKYYIVEKTVPAGYEAVYVDGDGNPISNPATLATNESGTQTVVNRKLLDVPIEKYWPDFSGDQFTWTATFQLEQMEVKVNADDPDADDAIDEFEPISGKTLTVAKDQVPVPTFSGLPMYRMHENGTLYRILYSVAETAYEVKQGSSVVASWDKTTGTIVEHQYTPQFEQDAGEHGSAIGDYVIKVLNTVEEVTATREINIGIHKQWPQGSDYADSDNAFAKFVLKRYRHEEYRDYLNVSADTEWVTITLNTDTAVGEEGSRHQVLEVPQGTTMHIVGDIKGNTNANKIAFSQTDGGPIELIQNNPNATPAPFDIEFIADQTKTITLTQGDNYVVGGRDGFRLSDTYEGRTTDAIDEDFREEFTLNKSDGWSRSFEYLPLFEEQNVDPKTGSQTIYVYSYYLEEVECNPSDFYATYTSDTGLTAIGADSRIDTDATITALNQQRTFEITLRKVDVKDVNAVNPATLPGAAFKLVKCLTLDPMSIDTSWGSDGEMAMTELQTDGVFTCTGLPAGYYKIVETAYPAGYVQLESEPCFQVSVNGDNATINLVGEPSAVRVMDNAFVIVLGNEPGKPLPITGGPGTSVLVFAGVSFVLLGIVLLARGRRRSE